MNKFSGKRKLPCFSIVDKEDFPVIFVALDADKESGNARVFSSFKEAQKTLEYMKSHQNDFFKEYEGDIEDIKVSECFLLIGVHQSLEN